jgi:hypothetical protein
MLQLQSGLRQNGQFFYKSIRGRLRILHSGLPKHVATYVCPTHTHCCVAACSIVTAGLLYAVHIFRLTYMRKVFVLKLTPSVSSKVTE